MDNSYFDLRGKGAIVTGSSRGIGRAIAAGLAAQGANVVISSRKQSACENVAAEISETTGGTAKAIACNIGDKAELHALIEQGAAALGKIDVLVCNAASNPYFGPLADISDAQFEKILHNNVLANHWLTSLVAPLMARNGGGSIILISSIGGLRGSETIGAYNISKSAMMQLARNLAVEHGKAGVRVNCIAPGLIRTEFARALWEDEANLERVLRSTALGRIGEPSDVAGAAVFLASDAARYITGQTIIVDGGATITSTGI